MDDDIIPSKKHIWERLHDEINGILIFMTDIHEEYFLNSDIWLIDVTFRTSPREYAQVLNVMGCNLLSNTYLTIGHILLKSKKENDYKNGLSLFLSQVVSSLSNLRARFRGKFDICFSCMIIIDAVFNTTKYNDILIFREKYSNKFSIV